MTAHTNPGLAQVFNAQRQRNISGMIVHNTAVKRKTDTGE